MFFEAMHPSWQQAMPNSRPLLQSLEASLAKEPQSFAPAVNQVMRAFEVPIESVKVLIVGQDPYPTPGHAVGLAFAANQSGGPLPRSLLNIMKELHTDLAASVSCTGDIERWASQGVFLLNRHLTTQVGAAGSHSKLGWAAFTNQAITALAESKGEQLVAILWGKQAQELEPLLARAAVLRSAHPSPLSAQRGFFGSKPFSAANRELIASGHSPIDWSC